MNRYKWQQEALDLFLEKKHLIANVCTGAGKTIYGIDAIKELRKIDPNYMILVVVPKIVILETVWLKGLNDAGLGPDKVGIYYGYAHEFSKITLTTIASISRLDLSMFDAIIVDEIHNMLSASLIKLLKKPFKYKLGLSASIKRRDQKHWKLLEYFNYNQYEYTMKQAIDDGIINKFVFNMIGVKIKEPEILEEYNRLEESIKQYLTNGGGLDRIMRLPATDPTKMAVLKMFGQRNDLINNYIRKVEIIAELISKENKKTLVFSQYNKITRDLYWVLKDYGVRSEVINTNVKKNTRDVLLKEFEKDKYNVLLSSRIFEEGYNLPKIDRAIFLSSNSTSRQMIQRLGRVLRKKDYSSEAYYVYCVGTFEERYAEAAKTFVNECAERITEVVV